MGSQNSLDHTTGETSITSVLPPFPRQIKARAKRLS